MSTTTIERILLDFKKEHNIYLSKVPRKKIIYDGRVKNSSSIVVVMPASKYILVEMGGLILQKLKLTFLKNIKLPLLYSAYQMVQIILLI